MGLPPRLWFALALLLLVNVSNWGTRTVVVADLFVAGVMAVLLVATRIWPDKIWIRRTKR